MIIRILSFLVLIEGVFMWLALPFSFYYKSGDAFALFISGLITSGIGAIGLIILGKMRNDKMGKREAYIIVSLTWVIISLFGTLPFVIHGAIPSFTNAFFEVISGFTTTGASILPDIEAMPEGLLFWRSTTHWIGGMGIIVLTLAILPFLGIGGMQLFAAEVPGPTPDKLHPRITGTAKRLWGIYVLFTFVQTILLIFGGMSLFDALCHSFGTMATGGFSTQNASIANYSPYIQYVIIVFMFLAGVNFSLHYLMLHGKISKLIHNEEFRFYAFLTIIFAALITLILYLNTDISGEKAFRDSLFQVISIITTTGFVSSDYLLWPPIAWFLIFALMFSGGSAGSTGGGIKAIRHLMLFKASAAELKKLIHPRAVIMVRYNDHSVNKDYIFNILAFFLFYIMIFGFGSLVMASLGLDFETAIGATIASLGNIGPGIGGVGPVENYANIPTFGKWFLSFLMLLGRLELFTILVFLSPGFWKK
ncbi:MAG: TrkH family potassium uptake protein [Bacteroidales bacterium]|nr:TrkH family potassium uptake protein [Bacteroidales bacterium]